MKDLGKLQITTPSDREIAMSREFRAPQALVWEAYTRPEHLTRWLGVHNGWTFPICEMDLQVGGNYRWVWRSPNGMEMAMGGVYREIAPSRRIVCTERFDNPWYEGEAVDTVEFVEKSGVTTLTMTVLYDSKAIRDAVLQSPMESGVAAGFDKLEALLPSFASA
ncbi:MAG: SRPBCC family protein [Thermoanaerobaculia bacterium]